MNDDEKFEALPLERKREIARDVQRLMDNMERLVSQADAGLGKTITIVGRGFKGTLVHDGIDWRVQKDFHMNMPKDFPPIPGWEVKDD